MPPGRPGRGTPEGMKAASRTASRTTGDGARHKPHTRDSHQPRLGNAFPPPPDHRLAGTCVKDASGAGYAGRAVGPVLDPAARSHETGSREKKAQPRGQFSTPCKQCTHAKPQASSPLDTGPLLQG